jgi:hypothetical protein
MNSTTTYFPEFGGSTGGWLEAAETEEKYVMTWTNDKKGGSVDSADGYIRIAIESEKTIVETVRNTIITIDETDPTAITIELVKASS